MNSDDLSSRTGTSSYSRIYSNKRWFQKVLFGTDQIGRGSFIKVSGKYPLESVSSWKFQKVRFLELFGTFIVVLHNSGELINRSAKRTLEQESNPCLHTLSLSESVHIHFCAYTPKICQSVHIHLAVYVVYVTYIYTLATGHKRERYGWAHPALSPLDPSVGGKVIHREM